ncbi:MAG: hypothetical protein A4E65_02843 [Syntrophorhabdus sp. PtaU1.Bin153]|nr:MAG: hypothetical protein A4E65_02843 [Syntrophorhabdus sp. PtaU1.Bin153]
MKRSAFLVLFLLCASLFLVNTAYAQKMETATGKVVGIDSEGKGIAITTGEGKTAMLVGAIVSPDTVVEVKGKKANLSDINVGDKVTIKYEKSTDLYAKKIMKR